jgi:hypothetical protein
LNGETDYAAEKIEPVMPFLEITRTPLYRFSVASDSCGNYEGCDFVSALAITDFDGIILEM